MCSLVLKGRWGARLLAGQARGGYPPARGQAGYEGWIAACAVRNARPFLLKWVAKV